MKKQTQSGITLIELTVVLLILIALAGLVVPYMGGTSSKALCDATDLSMQNIKKAIMNGYYLDTLGKFPQDLNMLTSNPLGPKYNLHYLYSDRNIDGSQIHKPFDPDSATGWRDDGYLQGGISLDSANPVYKASNLSTTFTDATFVHDALADGHVIVLDGWGRPIIIQFDSTHGIARLVSAGSGSGIGLMNEQGVIQAHIESPIGDFSAGNKPATSDDRILYLNAPTPATDINPSCAQ